jgi:hypothetical protein
LNENNRKRAKLPLSHVLNRSYNKPFQTPLWGGDFSGKIFEFVALKPGSTLAHGSQAELRILGEDVGNDRWTNEEGRN